jgi:pilus assembly protein CpaD
MIKYILPALVLLGGCSSSQIKRAPALDVVSVTNKLTFAMQGPSLSVKQRKVVEQFVQRKGSPYGLNVKLVSLSKSGQRGLDQIEALLIEQGIAVKNIHREHLTEKGKGDVQILVESFKAKVPKCQVEKYSDNFINQYKEHPSFGCATSVALAQMVVNPKDLVVGEQLGATNGAKAVATIDGYIAPVINTGSQTTSEGNPSTEFGGN